jgi:hypothetical protein
MQTRSNESVYTDNVRKNVISIETNKCKVPLTSEREVRSKDNIRVCADADGNFIRAGDRYLREGIRGTHCGYYEVEMSDKLIALLNAVFNAGMEAGLAKERRNAREFIRSAFDPVSKQIEVMCSQLRTLDD